MPWIRSQNIGRVVMIYVNRRFMGVTVFNRNNRNIFFYCSIFYLVIYIENHHTTIENRPYYIVRLVITSIENKCLNSLTLESFEKNVPPYFAPKKKVTVFSNSRWVRYHRFHKTLTRSSAFLNWVR